MKITRLQLTNFKRFTNLTIQDIPEKAKLVLLIGSNGSGKSSVFDAFERISTEGKEFGIAHYLKNEAYYSKNKLNDYKITINTTKTILESGAHINHLPQKDDFYGRTSFRQVSRLTKNQIGAQSFDISSDSDRPKTFIDRDNRFENDLEHLLGKVLRDFFRTDKDKSSIKKEIVEPINDALERIFGNKGSTKLKLIEIIPPLEGKTALINFSKGESEFHYNQLSAGEKEVFNILINLVARRQYYQDTIYFFDEIDLHLNTKLQYNFIKEMVENWIPENCQLWTASHSLGFIDYANEHEQAVIIDLDDLDFDLPQTLITTQKNDFEVFEIAVSNTFIEKVIQGRKIIFSENTDTPFFNDLSIANALFFVAIDKNDVFHKAKNHKQFGLVDRDYLSDNELVELKQEYQNLYFLPYYSVENLFFHPDNLEEYYSLQKKEFNKQAYIDKLTVIKKRESIYIASGIVPARAGYPFYKENENSKKLKLFKESHRAVVDLLSSDDFETYYKIFPAKDYGKEISERQNISKHELAKTTWFKFQIEKLIK